MGLEDLGDCVFVSYRDAHNLGIKFENLEKIMDSTTPTYNGFSFEGISKRLKKYISKKAKKEGADLALIKFQADSTGIITSMGYSFALYKYGKD